MICTKVSSLMEYFVQSPSLLALTGTASDAVLSDVQRDLSIFGDDSMILPETFDREELQYSIINCSALSKTATISDIIKNLDKNVL